MSLFSKSKTGIASAPRSDSSDHGGVMWARCDACKEVVYRDDWEAAWRVCHACGHHHFIEPEIWLRLLLDPDSFEEHDAGLASADPLEFAARKRYRDSLASARKVTGRSSAVVSGMGKIEGRTISLGVMDFRFLGGSMGVVEGEKIARVLRRAHDRRCPALVITASGGARMHEGTFSLHQMIKTSAEVARLRRAGIPYIVLLTHPTTGGVTASFAMLGDVQIAEPGALIGFAGERVIRETIRQALPDGFQRSEFLLRHGFLDQVVPRQHLRATFHSMLGLLLDPSFGDTSVSSSP